MSKRRKKREIQTIWIDDPCANPVQDIKDFARLLKEQRTDDVVMSYYSFCRLQERWLQSQNNVL